MIAFYPGGLIEKEAVYFNYFNNFILVYFHNRVYYSIYFKWLFDDIKY